MGHNQPICFKGITVFKDLVTVISDLTPKGVT